MRTPDAYIINGKRYTMEDIVKALTPPTAEEVCEALGDWLGAKEVYITDEGHIVADINFLMKTHTRDIGKNHNSSEFYIVRCEGYFKGKIKGSEKLKLTYSIIFNLPQHLITMIGEFYEAKEETG